MTKKIDKTIKHFNIPLWDSPSGKKLQRTHTEAATHSHSALPYVISISIDSSTSDGNTCMFQSQKCSELIDQN